MKNVKRNRRIDRTKDTSPNNRRLDSIARLLVGDDACMALCFDGDQILYAANKKVEGENKRLLKKYQ